MSADPKPTGPARPPWWHPAFVLGTWFGAGLLPLAPGTWGSAATLPVVWLVHTYLGLGGLMAAAGVAVGLAWWMGAWWAGSVFSASASAQSHDPGEFVLDEVAGQMLTFALALAVMPANVVIPNVVIYGAGFALFRLFDIAKPWPVGWADRNVAGGLGMVLDDVFAGAYAGAVLIVISYFI